MNSNRLPLVGLVVMIIVTVFALALQQQAVNDLRTQVTRAAIADNDRVTAVAMGQAASSTQAKVEEGQATAVEVAKIASTGQATAQSAAGTAIAQGNDAGTRSAQYAVTVTANSNAIQATATMHANDIATLQAESTAEVATLQGQLDDQSTAQAQLAGALGTATAQIDLADFARKAAEDDRSNALNQLYAIGTRQADSSSQLATAQSVLTGAPPVTSVPQATVTAATETEAAPTSTSDTATEAATSEPATSTGGDVKLTQTFTSSDKKVQVGYPDGWFAQETQSGTIVIVNQKAMYTRTSYKLEKGQFEVDILAGTYAEFSLTPGTAPQDLLATIVGNVKAQQATFQVGDVTTLKVNGHDAAQVAGSDGDNDVSITVIQVNASALAVVYGFASVGEGDANTPNVTAVMNSVTYSG